MKNFDDINEKRKTFINPESLGYKAADCLYGKGNFTFKEVEVKNKGMAINIRIHEEDKKALTLLGEIFQVPRSKIIAELISVDINTMFNTLEYTERAEIAQLVDREITALGLNHPFMEMTWEHYVRGIDISIDDPTQRGNWEIMQENAKRKGKSNE